MGTIRRLAVRLTRPWSAPRQRHRPVAGRIELWCRPATLLVLRQHGHAAAGRADGRV